MNERSETLPAVVLRSLTLDGGHPGKRIFASGRITARSTVMNPPRGGQPASARPAQPPSSPTTHRTVEAPVRGQVHAILNFNFKCNRMETQ